jgi:glutamate synthase (NADPH/NADH) small chain
MQTENIRKISTRERLQINRQKMPEQSPDIRIYNFREVNLGLPEHIAILEAQRCLQCKDAKCIAGCPVMVNIPEFIKYVSEGNLPAAAECLLSDNALPAITGRVCPQETQCEMVCIRGIKGAPVAIGYLERYVADWYYNNMHRANPIQNSPSVARLRLSVPVLLV